MVATPGVDEDQLTCWAITVLPASRTTALYGCTWPAASSVFVDGVMAMLAGAWATTSVALPLTAPALAVIVVLPFATAVAAPVAALIDATPGMLDAQEMDCPGIAAPFALRAVAVNCWLAPSDARLACCGVTVTEVTVRSASGSSGSVDVPSPPHATVAASVQVAEMRTPACRTDRTSRFNT